MVSKIFLVDDHSIIRYAYRTVINAEPDLKVCGEAASSEQALREIPALSPDLVVTDISLEGPSGLTLTDHLQKNEFPVPVLVSSSHQELFYVRQALAVGGKGYLSKKHATAHLVEAIRTVLDGSIYLRPQLRQHLQAASKISSTIPTQELQPQL